MVSRTTDYEKRASAFLLERSPAVANSNARLVKSRKVRRVLNRTLRMRGGQGHWYKRLFGRDEKPMTPVSPYFNVNAPGSYEALPLEYPSLLAKVNMNNNTRKRALSVGSNLGDPRGMSFDSRSSFGSMGSDPGAVMNSPRPEPTAEEIRAAQIAALYPSMPSAENNARLTQRWYETRLAERNVLRKAKENVTAKQTIYNNAVKRSEKKPKTYKKAVNNAKYNLNMAKSRLQRVLNAPRASAAKLVHERGKVAQTHANVRAIQQPAPLTPGVISVGGPGISGLYNLE
jgi:hypothetical protein